MSFPSARDLALQCAEDTMLVVFSHHDLVTAEDEVPGLVKSFLSVIAKSSPSIALYLLSVG